MTYKIISPSRPILRYDTPPPPPQKKKKKKDKCLSHMAASLAIIVYLAMNTIPKLHCRIVLIYLQISVQCRYAEQQTK